MESKYSTITDMKPLFDSNTRILILGSLPGEKTKKLYDEKNKNSSSQYFCYYSNMKNRFWKVMSYIYGININSTSDIDALNKSLLKYGVGLWDVVKYAKRKDESSNDSDIDWNESDFNNLKEFIINNNLKIDLIIFNGKNPNKFFRRKANKPLRLEFEKFAEERNIQIEVLPSTSGANSSITFDELKLKWEIHLKRKTS